MNNNNNTPGNPKDSYPFIVTVLILSPHAFFRLFIDPPFLNKEETQTKSLIAERTGVHTGV